jgi:hypothetical protein
MSNSNGWTVKDNGGGWTIIDRAGKSVCACSSNVKRPNNEKFEIAKAIVKTPELLAIRAASEAILASLIKQGIGGDLVTSLGIALLDYNA